MATTIAEGKLDPCTMEAFNYFPSSESHLNLTTTFQTDRLHRQETSTMSTQESCFTVVSSHKTRGQRITVMKQEPLEEMNQQLSGNNGNESLALKKLVMPFKSRTSEEITILPDKNGSIVPDNNPFKKRKLDELVLNDQMESFMEQESVVIEVESLEILCVTPESQRSVESKPIKITKGNRRGRGEKKVKKVDCFNSENKKNGILNFFSQV